jgi:hypothetical protein
MQDSMSVFLLEPEPAKIWLLMLAFASSKIQVKTAWVSNGCALYKSQRRQPGTGLTRRAYKSGEVDYFVAYCPTTAAIYAVPAEKHGVEGRLRLEPVRNGQAKLV